MSVRALVTVLVAVAAGMAGCSSTATLRSDEVESAIVAGLSEQFPEREFAASCPADVVAESGGVFTCSVVLGDGSELTVTVTQTDAEGDLRWEVTGVEEGAASPAPSASPA